VAVDANIYPAGFNNILESDQALATQAFDQYLNQHFTQSDRILLITEEHTLNKFYWDNIQVLKKCLEATGRKVLVAFPRSDFETTEIESFSQGSVRVTSGSTKNPEVRAFNPNIIISNNDFSQSLEQWASEWELSITPPRELGWYQRQKSLFFSIYNDLAVQLADLLEMDPFWFQVKTELFESFDIETEQSQKELAQRVELMFSDLRQQYQRRGITHRPVVFIKNNAGTYGLAVTQVHSGQEVLEWGYRHRKRMKAAKGGRKVNQLILQEGIPTEIQFEGQTAESVIYMVGCKTVGHFLRYHSEKRNDESLNSPGAKYKSLPVANLNSSPSDWVARLGLISIGFEARKMGVSFKNFHKNHCLR
jgi:glutamate--cysteine ligase